MCGYCIEEAGVNAFLYAKDKIIDPMILTIYLQEEADIFGAIDEVDKSSKFKSDKEKLEYFNSSVLLCKVIENISNGLQSQVLLNNDFIQKAVWCECIDNDCTVETLERLCLLPQIQDRYPLQRKLTEEQFQRAAEVFPRITVFFPLYQAETYFLDKQWQSFINQENITETCIDMLEHYADWWLKGGSLESRGSDAIEKDLEGTGVVYDPIMDISQEDRLLFDFIFRALFFSLEHLDNISQQPSIVEKILFKETSSIPYFDAMDLWLQRKTASIIYRQRGVDFFLESVNEIRPLLLGYIVAKHSITGDFRRRIADAIQSSKRGFDLETHEGFIRDPEGFREEYYKLQREREEYIEPDFDDDPSLPSWSRK